MKSGFKYLLFFILIASCQNIEKAPKPEKLIPEPKMIDILEDLAKIDAATNLNQKAYNEKGFDATRYIFEKYGIDSAQFARNNAYYLENFEASKRMYEEVRHRLEKQKKVLDSIIIVEDSVRQAEKKLKRGDSLRSDERDPLNKTQKFFSKIQKDSLD